MAKKSVEDMIAELEIFIDNCKFSPLSSNKIMVPKDELNGMLDELRLKLPSEIERSKKIMRNKEALLTQARNEADKMLYDAKVEVDRMVATHEIVQLAQLQANEVIQMAQAQAAEILENAQKEADDVRLGAMYYTQGQLENIKKYIAATLEAEKTNYTHLIESLENDAFVVTTNAEEIDNQIRVMTGEKTEVAPEPVTPAVEGPLDPVVESALASRAATQAAAQTAYEETTAGVPMGQTAPIPPVGRSVGSVVDGFAMGGGNLYE